MIRPHVVSAVFRKNLSAAFSNPTAYVFITIFIVTCAVFQFSWGDTFFRENLAELGPLNSSFPYLLLFFIPVLTMNSWSEERKLGTEEFILTLPATDFEVIIGKYKSLLVTYLVALIFSFSIVFVLNSLGAPDYGLIFSNYLAYILLGAAMLSIGIVASMLTDNSTIAFILGVLFNAIFMFTGQIATLASSMGLSSLGKFLENLGFGEKSGLLNQFTEMASGVLTLSGVIYLVSVTAIMLYLSMILVGRRHWAHGNKGTSLSLHYSVRVIALIIALTALNVILGRSGARADLTAAQIHSFSPVSAELMQDLKKPVLIEAFISEKVPEDHIEIRKNLLSTLREIEAGSGGNVRILIHQTEANSKEANEASEKYNIRPRQLQENSSGSSSISEVFMGAAITSGANQEVIPFMDRGLSPEYELVRSIRVVSQSDRKKVGILKTQVNITGGMNFQTRQNIPAWLVVEELRKQYEIIDVAVDSDYPGDLDVLLAVLPSTLQQAEMDRLQKYILSGKKTMLLCDSLPINLIHMSPSQRHMPATDPNMGGGQNAGAVKGDIKKMLVNVGVDFNTADIVWSGNNPYPSLSHLPYEIPFSLADNKEFNKENDISKELQVVVSLFPGHISAAKDAWTSFTPLMSLANGNHGTIQWGQMVESNYMGARPKQPQAYQHFRKISMTPLNLGAYVSGSRKVETKVPESKKDDKEKAEKPKVESKEEKVDMIVIADIDFISDQFFGIRRQGIENLDFDNVTLFLNAIDFLSGDKDFIQLRNKRKNHHILTKFDSIRKDLDKKRMDIVQQAEKDAEKELEKAQKVLDETVAEVQKREDLKPEEKVRILATIQEAQSRAFSVKKEDIDKKKARKVQDAERELNEEMKAHKQKVVIMAVTIPPLLPLLLAFIVYFKRKSREIQNVSKGRLKEGQS
ncbi:MAG: Gldg family protein [Lentisphaeraceae bacterium]|nr:Gldg family protein [Lentisphaeraceae bacterium]